MSVYNFLSNSLLNIYSKKLVKKYTYPYSRSMKERYADIPLFINGWQAVCMESEVTHGNIISKNIMGRDIVIWKSNSGKIAVQSAHCSHFGIHLGSGGKIKKDHIICPFHHRAFTQEGKCEGKNKKPIYTYSLDINGGVVFAWFHDDYKLPSWKLPRLEIDYVGESWCINHQVLKGVNVKAHPMEFIENGVDFNHAIKLHGLCHDDTQMFKDEHSLSIRFKRGDKNKGNININAYGPFVIDYNFDFFWLYPIKHRFLVLLQMMSDGSFTAHRLKMKEVNRKQTIFMKIFLKGLFIFNELKIFKGFMKEDHMIMLNRVYLDCPDYEEEDLYNKDFRAWYSQFYPLGNIQKENKENKVKKGRGVDA